MGFKVSFEREFNLRRWQEIAVHYWTSLRIIIRAGLRDAKTRISLRRIDTIMRLSELKTKAKSVRNNQELELSDGVKS